MHLTSSISIFSSFFFIMLISSIAHTQDLSGTWKGRLYQDEKDKSFLYELKIEQEDGLINGTSYSLDEASGSFARFKLSGTWDGNQLMLQEVKQTEPASPKWCLKYITLQLDLNGQLAKLKGRWKADGCTPGDLILESKSHKIEKEETVEPPALKIEGTWMGFLYQDDRNYGFYYEFELKEGNQGTSYIVSEDNGGSARHELIWSYDEETQELIIKEKDIIEKTDDKWRWCIKMAKLQFSQTPDRYILEGDWKGYIEGFTLDSGPCAPGKMLLERLIPSPQVTLAKQNLLPYEEKKERKVKVERILEVQSPNLLLKVWDNGTVDGDVVTLFLNGDQLVENYRVSKRKYGMNVKLSDETNFLILHAEDLGDISPNTVAVSVDDGVKEQIIILSSNLKESGALMIRQFKLD